MGDYYNYDDAINPDSSFSLSLLVSCLPVHKEQTIARAKIIAGNDKNLLDYAKQVRKAIKKQTNTDNLKFEEELDELRRIRFEREAYGGKKEEARTFSNKMCRMKLYHF